MSPPDTNKNLSSVCTILGVTILCVFAQHALADVTTVPGTFCAAINPTQAKGMEFRESGVINRDPNRDLWVICPLLRDASEDYADPVYMAAAAIVFNDSEESSFSTEILCTLRELIAANRIRGATQTVDVQPQKQAAVSVSRWVINDPTASHFQFQCRLPPDTGVAALLTELHGSEGSMIEDSLVELGLITSD
jgi:hypothetical protein